MTGGRVSKNAVDIDEEPNSRTLRPVRMMICTNSVYLRKAYQLCRGVRLTVGVEVFLIDKKIILIDSGKLFRTGSTSFRRGTLENIIADLLSENGRYRSIILLI